MKIEIETKFNINDKVFVIQGDLGDYSIEEGTITNITDFSFKHKKIYYDIEIFNDYRNEDNAEEISETDIFKTKKEIMKEVVTRLQQDIKYLKEVTDSHNRNLKEARDNLKKFKKLF